MIARVPGNGSNHIMDIIMSCYPLTTVATLEKMDFLWIKRLLIDTGRLAQEARVGKTKVEVVKMKQLI